MSVTEEDQEAEVRQAIQSLQDEFLPLKENIMTLREHLERTGTANTLIRQLSAGFPEFSSTDADRVPAQNPHGTRDSGRAHRHDRRYH